MSQPIPRNFLSSPTAHEQLQREDDASSHVTRGEFRALRSDVHDIKEALMGTMEKPGFLEKFRKMQERIGLASKVAWIAFLGLGGLLGKLAWEKLTGNHP